MKKSKSETKRRPRKPAEGSLAWYKQEWAGAFGEVVPQDAVNHLAQLSYENKKIRERLERVERYLVSQAIGTVLVSGVQHLIICAKKHDEKARCTCGATPEGASLSS